MKDYYKNGQRVLIGGVPCKVAKWVTPRMLAVMRDGVAVPKDKEEKPKPVARYYESGKRVVFGGVPCRVADWTTPRMLKVMRESPVTSYLLAKEQVKGGALDWSPGRPLIPPA